jgi:hypothetical protein
VNDRAAGGSPTTKYDALAEDFTACEYGDPGRYFERRAEIVVALGPRLEPGDHLLDLACADASFADALLARGLAYTGVDASSRMLEVAAARLAGRGRVERGDLLAYEPPEPVAATTCFRSLHFVPDRAAWFRGLAGFTEKKLVFDVAPRRVPLATIRAELRAAGLPNVAVRPFLVPQHVAVPAPVAAALRAAERVPPLARLLLARRFAVIVAAWR